MIDRNAISPFLGIGITIFIIFLIGARIVTFEPDPEYVPQTYWHGIPPFFILIALALVLSLILGAASWIYNWKLKRKEDKKNE